MRTVLTALAGVLVLSISSFAAEAARKKCKAGYEFDPDKGKCVLVEGS